MHPAPSIIIFTTLSGAGFGGVFWLGLGTGPDGWPFALIAGLIAGGLAAAGLAASTFHLGHPERAWRALSQWRSSWLSREGVLAAATLMVFGIYLAIWIFGGARVFALGLLASTLAAATVFATAMIYAQMRTVPRWRLLSTRLFFLAFAAAGGALSTALAANLTGAAPQRLIWVATIAILIAALIKFAWFRQADATSLAAAGTPESATGLGAIGQVRLLEAPHSSPNYLMREMVFSVGRRRAGRLRQLAAALGAVLPVALLILTIALGGGWALLALALIAHLTGVAASRWLFFAEAEHTVGLYYGRR